METLGYSWIAASAISPLAIVLSIWCLYIFHTYNRKWRTVDLFLVALTSEELICAVFIFSFSIINLIDPLINQVCAFVLWGLTAVRTLQILTLTSMVVDRAMTIKWPYKYRFSVRRNQIRYHITVLAVIAMFVGVAAMFARHYTSGLCPFFGRSDLWTRSKCCSTHPHVVDIKFLLFIISLYGFLSVTTFVAVLHILIYKCQSRRHKSLQLPTTSTCRPLTNHVLMMPYSLSPAPETETESNSMRKIHYDASKQQLPPTIDSYLPSVPTTVLEKQSNRPYDTEKQSTDIRWSSAVAVAISCYSINHIPYLVVTILSLAISDFWTPLLENVMTWLHLSEGILLPLIMWSVDSTYRDAVNRTFNKTDEISSNRDERRYGCSMDNLNVKMTSKVDELSSSHYPVMEMAPIVPNYKRKSNDKNRNKKTKNRPALRVDIPCGQWSPMNNHNNNNNMLSQAYNIDYRPQIQSCYLNNSRLPSMESDLDKDTSAFDRDDYDDDDKHIYATLSELNFQNHPTLEIQESSESELELDSPEDDTGSCTTSANDDFEFHDNRFKRAGCGVTVIKIGGQSNVDRSVESGISNSDYSSISSFRGSDDSINRLILTLNRNKCNIGRNNPAFISDDESSTGGECIPNVAERKVKLKSSLSMNDIDLVSDENSLADDASADNFNTSKNESTVSLFHVFVGEKSKPGEDDGNQNNEDSVIFERVPSKGKERRLRRKIRENTPDKLGLITPSNNGIVRSHKVSRNGSQNRRWKVSIVDGSNSCRRNKVLSMKTLLTALKSSDVSYLDTGDLCKHNTYRKRVAMSEYI
ncbi:Uncharacterised protein g8349 [Pycnogonum litorale]